MKSWWMLKIAKMLVLVVIGVLAFGFFVMLLWNALIPEIFKGPQLSFWQAIGLLVLSHVLLRGGGHWQGGGWKQGRWKKKLEEKLAAMTPDEREKFKEEWRRRCGFYPGEFEKKEEPT